jgi:hypothetical protein
VRRVTRRLYVLCAAAAMLTNDEEGMTLVRAADAAEKMGSPVPAERFRAALVLHSIERAESGAYESTTRYRTAFDNEWLRLASIGACDEIGGASYLKVLGEYAAQPNLSIDIEGFIRRRANLPA